MSAPRLEITIVTDVASYYQTSSGTTVGLLYIRAGKYCFPGAGWTDFAAPVLSSWIERIFEDILREKDRVKLEFFDGTPFVSLALSPDPSVFEGVEDGCNVLQINISSFAVFLEAVIAAGKLCLSAIPDGRDREMLRVQLQSAERVLRTDFQRN